MIKLDNSITKSVAIPHTIVENTSIAIFVATVKKYCNNSNIHWWNLPQICIKLNTAWPSARQHKFNDFFELLASTGQQQMTPTIILQVPRLHQCHSKHRWSSLMGSKFWSSSNQIFQDPSFPNFYHILNFSPPYLQLPDLSRFSNPVSTLLRWRHTL